MIGPTPHFLRRILGRRFHRGWKYAVLECSHEIPWTDEYLDCGCVLCRQCSTHQEPLMPNYRYPDAAINHLTDALNSLKKANEFPGDDLACHIDELERVLTDWTEATEDDDQDAHAEQPTCRWCQGTGIGQKGDPDTSSCDECGGYGVPRRSHEREEEDFCDRSVEY